MKAAASMYRWRKRNGAAAHNGARRLAAVHVAHRLALAWRLNDTYLAAGVALAYGKHLSRRRNRDYRLAAWLIIFSRQLGVFAEESGRLNLALSWLCWR
jgi:hypothetical protein